MAAGSTDPAFDRAVKIVAQMTLDEKFQLIRPFAVFDMIMVCLL